MGKIILHLHFTKLVELHTARAVRRTRGRERLINSVSVQCLLTQRHNDLFMNNSAGLRKGSMIKIVDV